MGNLLRRAIGSRFAAAGFQATNPYAMVRIGRWALRRISSQPIGWAAPTAFDAVLLSPSQAFAYGLMCAATTVDTRYKLMVLLLMKESLRLLIQI